MHGDTVFYQSLEEGEGGEGYAIIDRRLSETVHVFNKIINFSDFENLWKHLWCYILFNNV